jgi:hypothetical protein
MEQVQSGKCTNGIWRTWDRSRVDLYGETHAESTDLSGSEVLGFIGSFRARETCTHIFRMWSTTYKTSNPWTPGIELHLDDAGSGIPEQGSDWGGRDLVKDYSYRLEA